MFRGGYGQTEQISMPVRRSPDAKTNGRSSPCRVGEQVELVTRYKSLANSWKELKEEMIMKAKKSKIISILLCSFMILVCYPQLLLQKVLQ